MPTKRTPLPDFAETFLAHNRGGVHSVVVTLHQWIRTRYIGVRAFTPDDARRFMESEPVVSAAKAQGRLKALLRYLDWLHEQGHLRWDPYQLSPHPKRLSPHAKQFIASLEVTLKPSSTGSYRTTLRIFEHWLVCAGTTLRDLDRRHIEAWLQALHRRGFHASTRRANIIGVRAYLRWLFERGVTRFSAEELIRGGDLPKLPTYLPRPLPPLIDAELQRRLRQSHQVLHRGLLIMRQTGLRIGELRGLPYHCVHVDPSGNRTLKVPLGKMNSERLVPLSDDTYALIEKLRQRGNPARKWLLQSRRRRPFTYAEFRHGLNEMSSNLTGTDGPIVSHRLRHTFATELLAGGMSLVSLMSVLGHRDHRMTLRYAAITQETVHEEYSQAMTAAATRYGLQQPTLPSQKESVEPTKLANDLIRWIQSHASGDRETGAVIKRLGRIHRWLTGVKPSDHPTKKARRK